MRVLIDGRLSPTALRVAHAVLETLTPLARDVRGTTYLGAGSADLVRPDDPRPHVFVPLTTGTTVDPVARCQIASADAVVAMDREEAVRLRDMVTGVVVMLEVQPESGTAAIHTASPFDAAEVAEFLVSAPEVAAALLRLDVALHPFDSKVVVDAVIEAAIAATLDSAR